MGLTLGAYSFVSDDWKIKDYPVDLWLDWHSKLFDEICLVTYGDAKLSHSNNVKIIQLDKEDTFDFSFYLKAETIAQHELNTDWKVLLDVDEFFTDRPDFTDLDRKETYAIKMHNLYGNLETEVRGYFPDYYWVIHTGIKKVLGDGGTVSGPYYARIAPKNAIKYLIWRYLKMGQHVSPLIPKIAYDVFHTGTVRKPEALSKKWKFQTEIEIAEGYKENEHRLQLLDEPFNYHNFMKIDKKNYLIKIDTELLPRILIENKNRFWHVDFSVEEYNKPIFT